MAPHYEDLEEGHRHLLPAGHHGEVHSHLHGSHFLEARKIEREEGRQSQKTGRGVVGIDYQKEEEDYLSLLQFHGRELNLSHQREEGALPDARQSVDALPAGHSKSQKSQVQ